MKNASGRILYVGKAKRIRRRLASYFVDSSRLTPKTQALVAKIAAIETLGTTTEKEALLLEESLIKKHRPRYNIVLRDDKQYVLFCLDKRTKYPRLTISRRAKRDGAVYYGPFVSAAAARETWKVINRIFPLRKCSDKAFRNRVRPCLYHHMGQCLAPCVNDVSTQAYSRIVSDVEMLLSGRSAELVRCMESEMFAASESMEFERAAVLRDRIQAVRRTVERQSVVLPAGGDLDAIDIEAANGGLALGVLFIRQGRLLAVKTYFWPALELGDAEEVLKSFLPQFYSSTRFVPPKVVLPWKIRDDALAQLLEERRGGKVGLRPARTGEEKHLLELARNNARQAAVSADDSSLGQLLKLRLHLARDAFRIECVDISHLGGRETRAGMVVFEDGKPVREAWRAYSLPATEGSGDDYLALAEWARRRVESGPPWPDLLLIDGGRGQLRAVEKALEEQGAEGEWELASIAKAGRSSGELGDCVFRPGRRNPLPLKSGSTELLFLQRVRDAAHEFVVGRQRQARNKKALKGRVAELPGIGPKTLKVLWERFPSVEAMSAARVEDFMKLPGFGRKRAEKIVEALKTQAES